jgi:hypothetical protein
MPPPPGAPAVAEVTVHLPDLEPVLGLVSACARLSLHLSPTAVEAMSEGAMQAFTQIQSILWRLEHAPVEDPPARAGDTP